MLRYILILFFSFLITNVYAENKKRIIENLDKIKNFDFRFEQNIN